MIRKRPPQAEKHNAADERDDDNSITIGTKHVNVKLDLSGRGIILVYAIAFAVIILAMGYVAIQLATAWKLTLSPVGPAIGFLTWALIAFTSAYASQ
jgi:hypothetical protein